MSRPVSAATNGFPVQNLKRGHVRRQEFISKIGKKRVRRVTETFARGLPAHRVHKKVPAVFAATEKDLNRAVADIAQPINLSRTIQKFGGENTMKRFKPFALILAGLFLLGGCASVTSALNKVNSVVTNQAVPDVCSAAALYSKYVPAVAGVVALLPIGATAGPIIATVNTLVGDLSSACSSGALASTVTAELNTINTDINELNTMITQAKAAQPKGVMATAAGMRLGAAMSSLNGLANQINKINGVMVQPVIPVGQ